MVIWGSNLVLLTQFSLEHCVDGLLVVWYFPTIPFCPIHEGLTGCRPFQRSVTPFADALLHKINQYVVVWGGCVLDQVVIVVERVHLNAELGE
jgi:hypothetical protein